jgi:hypothetical protein
VTATLRWRVARGRVRSTASSGAGAGRTTICAVGSCQARIALVATVALVASGLSAAATPAENVALAKQLKGDIKPVFAKQAPSLVLGKVTCTLTASGAVAHCIAHFTDSAAQAKVVYGIRATLKAKAITWTTTTHYCTSELTHKKLTC